jgi:hypothetical protein
MVVFQNPTTGQLVDPETTVKLKNPKTERFACPYWRLSYFRARFAAAHGWVPNPEVVPSTNANPDDHTNKSAPLRNLPLAPPPPTRRHAISITNAQKARYQADGAANRTDVDLCLLPCLLEFQQALDWLDYGFRTLDRLARVEPNPLRSQHKRFKVPQESTILFLVILDSKSCSAHSVLEFSRSSRIAYYRNFPQPIAVPCRSSAFQQSHARRGLRISIKNSSTSLSLTNTITQFLY